MKRLTLAALLAVVLLAAGFTYQTSRPRWEYRTVITVSNADDLNRYGVEGWELVSIHDSQTPLGVKTTFYFKREK